MTLTRTVVLEFRTSSVLESLQLANVSGFD